MAETNVQAVESNTVQTGGEENLIEKHTTQNKEKLDELERSRVRQGTPGKP